MGLTLRKRSTNIFDVQDERRNIMKLSVRTICMVAMFTAIISVLSIMQIPTPWGVPFTLQTFAMALCGYVLGWKYGTLSTVLYILIGAIGVPVFAGMLAGVGVLTGVTGGYLFGFIIMTFLCGIGRVYMKKGIKGIVWLVVFSALGLAACHILGIIQLKYVANLPWAVAAIKGSVPYLAKDIASVIGAYLVAIAIRRALRSTNLLDWENEKKANA